VLEEAGEGLRKKEQDRTGFEEDDDVGTKIGKEGHYSVGQWSCPKQKRKRTYMFEVADLQE